MAHTDPQTEAYVAGVMYAVNRATDMAVEYGIAWGVLSPAARSMTWRTVVAQLSEYAGDELHPNVGELEAFGIEQGIPAEPLSGEWAGESPDASLSDEFDPEGTLEPGVVGDAFLAGVNDVVCGTWSLDTTADDVIGALADDENRSQ